MKCFNVTGTCVGTEHYMVDISNKLDEIEKLVEAKKYFTINRARQYGKTTTLFHLAKRFESRGTYVCARITFENAGPDAFKNEENFCRMILQKVSDALGFANVSSEYAKDWTSSNVSSFTMLDKHITRLCKEKKLVLMIDEVDKTSNNALFLHFLAMLRAKFLSRQEGMDFTFHSVILAGVTDIKNLKLKMITEVVYEPTISESKIVNSPWNIAANFNVDMSFNPEEISSMLLDYEEEHNTGMDIVAIANEIYMYTDGYPFLVSRFCQCIDEELGKNWTIEGVTQAVQIILEERSVLFDDIAKNLENNKELRNFLYELLVLGEHKSFRTSNLLVDLANKFCYIKKGNKANCIISNKIFESYLMGYFIAQDENSPKVRRLRGAIYKDVIRGGKFDMVACMLKFAEYYRTIYSLKDEAFYERHGRLLFLSFITPLLNGHGFIHVETQLTDERRMDLVVDFEKEQFIIELKLWRGEAAKEKAYEQLLGYIEKMGANEGYLLTFDFRKTKTGEYKASWVDVGCKRIFDVVV